MTMTGQLSWYVQYLVKLGVIASGLVLNAMDFSVIAHLTSFICIAMIVPFVVAFFWTLPKLDPFTEWGACSASNWPLAITTVLWEFAGFESLGNLVNEVGFDTKRLYSAFGFAIVADMIMLLMPIMSAAVLASNECSDWFDGYFASAFGDLWIGLEYGVAIGSVAINWCIYVSAIGIVSRMVWATAQPYFKVRSGGEMVLEEDDYEGLEEEEDGFRIAINILPKRYR